MIKSIITLLLLNSLSVISQPAVILKTWRLPLDADVKAFYPKFINEDSEILFSSQSYVGLFRYEMNTGKTITISEKRGAGYNTRLSEDGKIFFKTFDLINSRKNYSIWSYDLINEETKRFVSDLARAKIPSQLQNNQLVYIADTILKKKIISSSFPEKAETNFAVYSEDDNLHWNTLDCRNLC